MGILKKDYSKLIIIEVGKYLVEQKATSLVQKIDSLEKQCLELINISKRSHAKKNTKSIFEEEINKIEEDVKNTKKSLIEDIKRFNTTRKIGQDIYQKLEKLRKDEINVNNTFNALIVKIAAIVMKENMLERIDYVERLAKEVGAYNEFQEQIDQVIFEVKKVEENIKSYTEKTTLLPSRKVTYDYIRGTEFINYITNNYDDIKNKIDHIIDVLKGKNKIEILHLKKMIFYLKILLILVSIIFYISNLGYFYHLSNAQEPITYISILVIALMMVLIQTSFNYLLWLTYNKFIVKFKKIFSFYLFIIIATIISTSFTMLMANIIYSIFFASLMRYIRNVVELDPVSLISAIAVTLATIDSLINLYKRLSNLLNRAVTKKS